MSFVVYPAIDVRGGRVVRLRQGDYAQETRYGDPYALAIHYADAGSRWLHLVDLDAARNGGYTLAPLLREIGKDGRLAVQTGGGVRTADDVQSLLDAGAQRVVLGSVAIRDPDSVCGWLRRFGAERLVLALDTRQDDDGAWRLPVLGWTQPSSAELFALLDRYADAGARHLLCTDIARDGMLGGPNVDFYTRVRVRYPALAVQASGGIRDADDLAALREAGCAGAIIGKALLDGLMTIAEALVC